MIDGVTTQRPVLILGGGIAGMTTAWELRRLGIPARVIEATPHLGGRIHTVREGNGLVETGMQFYYSAYRETKKLLREVGLLDKLVPIDVRGHLLWDDRVGTFSKTRPWLTMLSARQNLTLQMSVARQASSLLTMSPFDYRANDPLDQIDVGTYFRRWLDEATYEVAIRPMVNAYAFCEPEGHSLAMVLRILKLSGIASTHGLAPGNDALPAALGRHLDVLHARAKHVVIEDGAVSAVVIERDGVEETLPTSCVVSALRGPDASKVLGDAPAIAGAMDALPYSTILLANLHLDRPIPGPDWVYVMSRKAGHHSAFACDLARRAPVMFDKPNAMIQANFAEPVSTTLLGASDEDIIAKAISDMQTFLPEVADWVAHASVVRRPRVLPNFAAGMFDEVRRIEAMAQRIQGLHLAGDYLRSPLCEGAVRSGLTAVSRIVQPVDRAAAA